MPVTPNSAATSKIKVEYGANAGICGAITANGVKIEQIVLLIPLLVKKSNISTSQ